MTDLIDTSDDSPRTINAETMSDNLAAELIQDLDLGDWEVSDWEAEFIESNLQRTHFTFKQKEVIYRLAKKFQLL